MRKDETVGRFLDGAAPIWGRELTDAAVRAYVDVTEPYGDAEVASACDTLLKSSRYMPTPADLSDVLRDGRRSRQVEAQKLPDGERVPNKAAVKALVDELMQRMGTTRRRK